MPHVWHRGGIKKLLKSAFQRTFIQNGTHFNNLPYHWTANYCDKHLNQGPDTFSSIRPSWFYKVKYMGDNCDGVDRLVQWCRSMAGNRKSFGVLAFLCDFRHFTLHILTGRYSKILIVCKVLSDCARAARKIKKQQQKKKNKTKKKKNTFILDRAHANRIW